MPMYQIILHPRAPMQPYMNHMLLWPDGLSSRLTALTVTISVKVLNV